MNKYFAVLICFILPLTSFAELYKNDVYIITKNKVTEKYNKKESSAWIEGNTLFSNYTGEAKERTFEAVPKNYPTFESGIPMLDYLYKMAIHEIILDTKKGFFVAGEKWNQAWTRDMSYAIHLSLALIFNNTSIASLDTRIYDNKILQDTGTGGSYPISTDRITWAAAAYETALIRNDKSYYEKIYRVIKNSIEQDLEIVYNTEKKIFKGEQSFLDWREQTYPKSMNPTHIGESYALGTNIVHYSGIQVLVSLAEILGKNNEKQQWEKLLKELKTGINNEFWSEEKGYYGAYIIDGVVPFLYEGYETLGESLAILTGVANPDNYSTLLTSVKPTPFGMPVVAPQLAKVKPYHNKGIWPFVQGYRGWAAAQANDISSSEEEFYSVVRSAALFRTFKENLVANTGDQEGTAINSDRQLWSVASYLAYIYRVFLGMNLSPEGIKLSPTIYPSIKDGVKINAFKYHDAILNFEIKGTGNIISSYFFDEKPVPNDFIIPSNTTGNHTIKIELKGSNQITRAKKQWDSLTEITPVDYSRLDYEDNKYYLSWRKESETGYLLYKNDEYFKTIKSGINEVTLDVEENITEYTLYKPDQFIPLKGETFFTESKKNTIFIEAEKSRFKGGKKHIEKGKNKSTNTKFSAQLIRHKYNGKSYITKWGDSQGDYIEFTARLPKDGTYIIDFRYGNKGPLNTGEKCGIRELNVDNEYKRVLYFPHIGHRQWSFSSSYTMKLKKGTHKIKIYTGNKSYSQKNNLPPVDVDLMRIRKLK